MPISSSEILFKLSTSVASSGDSLSGVPSGSLGGYISTTLVPTGLHNLFDAVDSNENFARDIEYRCIFIHNNSSLTYQSPMVWVSGQTDGGASGFLGVDLITASAIGSTNLQAQIIANESTSPTGITFSIPISKESGLSIGDIPAGYCKGIWIRRNAYNFPTLKNDGLTIQIEGNSE